MPDNRVASSLVTGLSGDIDGYCGHNIRPRIGAYDHCDIRTAFAPVEVRSRQEGADGILGNDLIRRFNVIFSYRDRILYLRPNGMFGTPFD